MPNASGTKLVETNNFGNYLANSTQDISINQDWKKPQPPKSVWGVDGVQLSKEASNLLT